MNWNVKCDRKMKCWTAWTEDAMHMSLPPKRCWWFFTIHCISLFSTSVLHTMNLQLAEPLFHLSLYLALAAAAAAAKSRQSCLTLCDPIDGNPPGSPIPGILQARTLEWVAISFSNAWKWKGKVTSLSLVRLFATAWTAAYQAPPSMGFSRQEYWSISFYCCIKSYLKISSLKQ